MSARGINKVILVGRLGNDPEVRYIPNGGAVANLQVATSESWRDKQTGEMREQTEWHRVVLFGKLAEVAGEYLRKGAQVYIEGQLRTRSWEDNGITRYVTEILVKTTGTMQMLGRAAGAQTQPEEGQQFSGQPQPEPQSEAGTKKGGAKTKGRGRKAAQPEPQPQPPEGGLRVFRRYPVLIGLTVITAPPRPGPSGRDRVAFNYECCNYIFIAVSLLAGSSQYTLVSGPHGPLTRRYAPTSGKPSSGPLRPRTEALSWLKAGMVWQGWGWVR